MSETRELTLVERNAATPMVNNGAMDAVFHALGIAGATPRPTLIKAASLVLSAIEAIDKENGR